ncbi:MAG: hypothetical protein HGB35_09010 [Geobacteraceae bacterium]|nr:hypothetical protein [Geobacteraceae bacterium]
MPQVIADGSVLAVRRAAKSKHYETEYKRAYLKLHLTLTSENSNFQKLI